MARYLVEVTPRLHSQFVLAVFTGMVAAFQSERWPFSHRNGGRFPAGTLAVFVRNTHMETERQRTPNLLQSRRMVHVAAIPENLQAFFEEQGSLDKLLQRINNASMKVWQKLRSHLRELERKNNRLRDIRCRIEEIATLDAQADATGFMNDLLSQPLWRL